jgi:hypothetical protein
MDVPNLTIGRPVPAEIGSSNQANSPFCVASRVPESQKSGLKKKRQSREDITKLYIVQASSFHLYS